MYPTISSHLAQARIADLRRQAQGDALARAARLGPRRRRSAPSRAGVVPGTAQAARPAVAGEAPAR